MFETMKCFLADEGGDNLIVMGIVAAVLGMLAYGVTSFIKPRVKSGADKAGSNLDSANSLTY